MYNPISRPNKTALDDTGKDTFPWHDAVTDLVIYGAAAVTLLADLRYLYQGLIII